MSDEQMNAQGGDDQALADEWAAALEEQENEPQQEPRRRSSSMAETANFEELYEEHSTGQGEIKLDAILDVPVTIAMEIGRTRINIRNLLQLNQGSVVELDRLAGEPMDVLVNGTLVAQGEVVVVNEKFGIRLTDIVSPAERVKKLGE